MLRNNRDTQIPWKRKHSFLLLSTSSKRQHLVPTTQEKKPKKLDCPYWGFLWQASKYLFVKPNRDELNIRISIHRDTKKKRKVSEKTSKSSAKRYKRKRNYSIPQSNFFLYIKEELHKHFFNSKYEFVFKQCKLKIISGLKRCFISKLKSLKPTCFPDIVIWLVN